MKRFEIIVALALGGALALHAQAQPVPQNARQALLEMFFSKTPGTMEKHLPQATRAALRQADGPGLAMLQQFSMLSSQINAQGQQFQTFETGPTLLAAEDARVHSKLEITVERDDLQGDEDAIEVSFHAYKAGQPQNSYFMPRLTFVMKQEAGIWRLNELALAARFGLADPEFLKQMLAGMKQRQSVDESSTVSSMRVIETAEITYAATYPGRGYTCSLSDLDGFGSGQPSEHQAMLIESGLASGRKDGYIFTLSRCDGTPASKFRLTGVPADPSAGLRAFCSDESGVIRYAADGKAATCLSVGKPLQ